MAAGAFMIGLQAIAVVFVGFSSIGGFIQRMAHLA
jgi:hypothetical protein